MSAPKHTAGPWDAVNDEQRRHCVVAVDDAANGNAIIARLQGPDAEDNARLIAAAPELLEALGELYIYTIEDEDDVYLATQGQVIARAASGSPVGVAILRVMASQRAAIAKATGETGQ